MPHNHPMFTPRELRLAQAAGSHAATLAKPASDCPHGRGECLPLRCQWLAGYHDQHTALRGAIQSCL